MPAVSSILGAIALGVAAGGTAYSAYAQSEAASDQKDAQNQARAQANAQAQKQEQATNAANQKRPDTSAIMAAAQQASKSGGASTMLTGPTGIDPNALQLGKTSLLGS